MLIVGWLLRDTRGLFASHAVLALTLIACCYGLSLLVPSATPSHRNWTLAVLAGLSWELYLLSEAPLIIYPTRLLRFEALVGALHLAWIASLFGLLAYALRRESWLDGWGVFGLSVGFLLALRIATVAISPQPFIDVFSSGTLGAQHLLRGANPYSQVYPDIYGQRYGYRPGFYYGPSYLLASTVGWLLGDIRFANIAAELATIIAMLRLLRGHVHTHGARWLILVWLSFPVSLHMVEQAWVDPLVLAPLAWMWVFLRERRVLLAGVAAGVALAAKQTSLLAVGFTLLWWLRTSGGRGALRFALSSASTALLFYAPFLVWDAASTWRSLVTEVLRTPPRYDALTLRAWLAAHDADEVGASLWLAALGSCTLMAWWLARRQTNLAHLIGATALAYLVVFLGGFQAFCNYYWFVAGLMVLSLVAGWTEHVCRAPHECGNALLPALAKPRVE